MSSPTYGRRLIPHIIDERAHDTPERAVYSIPVDSADLSKGFKDISAFQLANAINRVAWWVQKKLGLQADFPTIGYMGPRKFCDVSFFQAGFLWFWD
jgi:acyl-CoA synthetase (AMP-forming)/AMP-acid ligase II